MFAEFSYARKVLVKSAKDLLSAFCQANDVILAIPKGMKASQCSKLARPILGDPKVNTMVSHV